MASCPSTFWRSPTLAASPESGSTFSPAQTGENVEPDSGEAAGVGLREKVEGHDAIPSCEETDCDL